MRSDGCVSLTDTGSMGVANGSMEPGEEHGKYAFIIPAGAMIGLGVGFLVEHVASGVLFGVGLGLLAWD